MEKMTNKDKIHVLARGVIIDQGHILLCKTTDLAHNFYFLPGGHVEHGESAEDAVLRELIEETGSKVEINRFLGCLEYSFEPSHSSICHNHEYNFIFEVSSAMLKPDIEIPKMEEHIELFWVKLSKLEEIDFRPVPLKKLLTAWLKQSADNVFVSEMI
jgi:8-oxo-dGTP diphosphatase